MIDTWEGYGLFLDREYGDLTFKVEKAVWSRPDTDCIFIEGME